MTKQNKDNLETFLVNVRFVPDMLGHPMFLAEETNKLDKHTMSSLFIPLESLYLDYLVYQTVTYDRIGQFNDKDLYIKESINHNIYKP